MRVLVVEDEVKLADLISHRLRREGMGVDVANNGEDALVRATATEYDLILLDLMLPGGISGRDVRLRQLQHPTLAALPTIVVSASDMDQRERLGLHPDAWLDKPYRFDDLLELVKRYVVSEGSVLQSDN